MDKKNTFIKVVNKYSGVVGYEVPDLNVHRDFFPNESKDISYEQLERLSFVPGGETILRQYLEITDKEVANQILHKTPEPEYYYSEEDIKRIMQYGTLDEFLDCLDFAPSVVIDMIKTLAVDLPLNDVAKRDAIKDKFGYDVTKAIEIKNTKYDGGDPVENPNTASSGRRAPIKTTDTVAPAATGRRYQAPKKEN